MDIPSLEEQIKANRIYYAGAFKSLDTDKPDQRLCSVFYFTEPDKFAVSLFSGTGISTPAQNFFDVLGDQNYLLYRINDQYRAYLTNFKKTGELLVSSLEESELKELDSIEKIHLVKRALRQNHAFYAGALTYAGLSYEEAVQRELRCCSLFYVENGVIVSVISSKSMKRAASDFFKHLGDKKCSPVNIDREYTAPLKDCSMIPTLENADKVVTFRISPLEESELEILHKEEEFHKKEEQILAEIKKGTWF